MQCLFCAGPFNFNRVLLTAEHVSKVIFEFRGPFGVPVQIGSSIMLLVMVFLFFGSSAA